MNDKKASNLERVEKLGIINYRGHHIPITQATEVIFEQYIEEASMALIQERFNQNCKWGRQIHSDDDWYSIAMEEVGEIAQALNKAKFGGKETDADNLLEEVIQSAAVFMAWAEQLMREKDGVNPLE